MNFFLRFLSFDAHVRTDKMTKVPTTEKKRKEKKKEKKQKSSNNGRFQIIKMKSCRKIKSSTPMFYVTINDST